MGNSQRKRPKTERMDMSRQIVRQPGQCTQCGITATHANECVTCHVVTLSVATIKNAFPADQIRSVAENMADTDLIADAKDTHAPAIVRRIASTVTRLAFANHLQVREVQRKLVTRLREAAELYDSETDQSRRDYMARIQDWIGTMLQKLRQ